MKLWPIQSAALLEAERANGLFAMMPVGTGKSLLAALLPDAMRSKNAVLLLPAQLKRKTLKTVWPELSQHFNLPLERIHLVSYTELERAPGDVLERLQPDLVIADEAHALKHPKAARTWRFLDYFKKFPATRFVAMSGTFTKASITEYAHLIRLALKDGSPLPRDYLTLAEWSEALDVSDNPRSAGALDRLCEDRNHVHSDCRNRFSCRLFATDGVVSLPHGFSQTALTLRGRRIQPPPNVIATIERLRKSWEVGNPEAPDEASEEVTDDLTYARFIRQLALGFYCRWRWPNGRDVEWLRARAQWHAAVRHILRYCRGPGLDSPMLVARAADRGALAREHQAAWEEWCAVKERPKPPTEVIWIDRYAVENAARWLREGSARIVFYEHVPIGEAIAATLDIRLPENATDIVMDGRPQILSLHRFRQGIDGLQHRYADCLYTSIPNAEWIEQSLGRLHREGQTRDVTAELVLPVPESLEHLRSAQRDAEYMESTGFGRQKLLSARMENLGDQ
jgi:hypothetical protein